MYVHVCMTGWCVYLSMYCMCFHTSRYRLARVLCTCVLCNVLDMQGTDFDWAFRGSQRHPIGCPIGNLWEWLTVSNSQSEHRHGCEKQLFPRNHCRQGGVLSLVGVSELLANHRRHVQKAASVHNGSKSKSFSNVSSGTSCKNWRHVYLQKDARNGLVSGHSCEAGVTQQCVQRTASSV